MSYSCVNQGCANNTTLFSPEAAEKLLFRCFLCEDQLEHPPLTLEHILENVDALPVAIQILPRLQQLLNNENSTIDDIVMVTRTDASLVTQILKISNSAIYVLPDSGFCSTLEEALNRIGFNTAYKVVGYVAAKQLFQQNLVLYNMSGLELWEASVRAAIAMQSLAPQIRASSDSYAMPDTSTAYTVGLLHPIGKMLINHYYDTEGIPALNEAKFPLTDETEKSALGFNHLEAAEKLLRKWNFQDEIVAPIRSQSNPLNGQGDRPLAALLSMVVDAVKQFPVSLDYNIEAMAEQYKPNSDLAAIVGIPKVEFIKCIASSSEDCKQLVNTFTC